MTINNISIRREILFLLFSIMILLMTTCLYAQNSTEADEKPNIIVFIIDDWRWDALAYAGNPIIQTPVIDDLAKNGAYFSNSFVDVPSNISHPGTYSGVHARTHGYNWDTGPISKIYTDTSYPQFLHNAGYNTCFVGKFPVRMEGDARDRMFDSFEIVSRNPAIKKYNGKTLHSTQYIAEKAMKFLDERDKSRNFLLAIALNDAHADDLAQEQYWPAPETEHLYEDVKIPELTSPTAKPEFYRRLPAFLYSHFNRIRWWQRYNTPERSQEMYKKYYRIITGCDIALGKIVEKLKSQQVDDNTIIIISGENGNFLGERGFGGKYLLYDVALRTPLIIFNPKAPKSNRGIIIDEMVLNLDIAPTIFELTGIKNPGLLSGHSLVPLMRGEQVEWRKGFLCQHLPLRNPGINPTEGYRTKEWKFIRYLGFPTSDELYDLVNDPDEAINLAKKWEYQEKYVEMRNFCEDAITEALRNKRNDYVFTIKERGY